MMTCICSKFNVIANFLFLCTEMVKVVKALRREDPALSQIKNLAEGMKLQFVIETSADDNILRESIFTNFSISSYLKSKEYDKQKVKE